MRVFIAMHPRGSSTEHLGGQSRCVKCDDDLTILEIIYEDNSSADNRQQTRECLHRKHG